MKEIILKQLKKCKNAKIPTLSGDETSILIKRCNNLNTEYLKLDHTYIIQVDKYVLSLTENNSTIVSNWNSGQRVLSEYLRVSLSNIVNNMYKFDGVGYDPNDGKTLGDFYSGIWIPKDHFVVIKEITQ